MFGKTTILLLGRSLLRISCSQGVASLSISNTRAYHPIIKDFQALFTKKAEPSAPKGSPHSNSSQSQTDTGNVAQSRNDSSSTPSSPGKCASGTSETKGLTPSELPKEGDARSSSAPLDKLTPKENGRAVKGGQVQPLPDDNGTVSLMSQLAHEGSVSTASSTAEIRSLIKDLLSYRKTSADLLFIHKLNHLTALVKHQPGLSKEVWDSGCVHFFRRLTTSNQEEVSGKARTLLSLIGQPPPYPKRGLRILAIDGGGTRALIPIAIMRHLERISHSNLFEMFDLVCGTSSGALCAYFICVERGGAVALERVCRRLGNEVFNTGEIARKVAGFSKLFTKHAFYDADKYEEFMKDYKRSDSFLLDTAGEAVPKLVFVSTVVNWPALEPFVFRNYRHRPSVTSHYKGTSDVRFWEALRASSAAPGYFEEFKLAQFVHHDGALLTNNPTAVGLHEARLLWGQAVPIQCIVSLGTGKYPWVEERDDAHSSSASIVDKLQGMLTSVTDSETVHTILKDILPSTSYFRFNPIIDENIPIDECDPEKLDHLLQLTEDYIDKHKYKLQLAARALHTNKTAWMKTRSKADDLLQSLQLNLYHRFKL